MCYPPNRNHRHPARQPPSLSKHSVRPNWERSRYDRAQRDSGWNPILGPPAADYANLQAPADWRSRAELLNSEGMLKWCLDSAAR
mmetsp:Transcript_27973/g.60989  ORF Transcript_27973/g.60989 Transcript_27973/m.60989 type:complete len:85 (+) Transcript_27973:524-778(+)